MHGQQHGTHALRFPNFLWCQRQNGCIIDRRLRCPLLVLPLVSISTQLPKLRALCTNTILRKREVMYYVHGACKTNSISRCPILEQPRCHYREKVSLPVPRVYMCARIPIIIIFLLRVRRRRLEIHTFLSKVNGRWHAAHATVFIKNKILEALNHEIFFLECVIAIKQIDFSCMGARTCARN